MRGEVSRIIEGGRRKALVMSEATEVVGRALDQRLTEHASGDVTEGTPLVEAGTQWLALIERPDSGKSANTLAAYRGAFERHIDADGSAVRGLTLAQVNRPPVLRRFLQGVADNHGTGSAKMVRSVLAGILGQAVDDGILSMNAIRSMRAVSARDGKSRQKRKAEDVRDTERALTRAERDAILAYADAQVEAAPLDRTKRKARVASDLMHFLAGTGVRISEARGLRWDDVNLAERRAYIAGTKTTGSRRAIALPVWLVTRLTERQGERGRAATSSLHRTQTVRRRGIARTLSAHCLRSSVSPATAGRRRTHSVAQWRRRCTRGVCLWSRSRINWATQTPAGRCASTSGARGRAPTTRWRSTCDE